MDKKEFALFASALRTYYPKEKILPNEQAMALWYSQLQDIPYKIAELTLNKWVALNKWSPSIADIREQATSITHEEIKDWSAAWSDVINSIRYYGSYQEEEALASLDDMTRQAVKRLGFKNLCLSENIGVDRANFRMIYEQLEQRKRNEAQIPQRIKDLIANNMPNLIESEGNT